MGLLAWMTWTVVRGMAWSVAGVMRGGSDGGSQMRGRQEGRLVGTSWGEVGVWVLWQLCRGAEGE